MMNADQPNEGSPLNQKTGFFRNSGSGLMNPTDENNRHSNDYSSAIRLMLVLCILFQINFAKAQSTPDSSNLADTASARTVLKDTSILKPFVRKPAKLPADTIAVFRTDTLRFSEKKPAAYNLLPVQWTDLLKSQPFFNFFGQPVHMRSEKYERESYDTMFYLLVSDVILFCYCKIIFW